MDRFEIFKQLGVGTYGVALLARKRSNSDVVVVKQVRLPYLLSQKHDPSNYRHKEVELAYQECKLLTEVDHQNIVKAYEFFEGELHFCLFFLHPISIFLLCFFKKKSDPQHCSLNLVLEYCDGNDLLQAIEDRKGAHFSEEQISSWFCQAVNAIDYLHHKNILHRDIKAANCFLHDRKRFLKIGDFGIAKKLEETGQLAKTQIGTPYCMAPEIWDQPYGKKAEIWALGILLYHMASLKLPVC